MRGAEQRAGAPGFVAALLVAVLGACGSSEAPALPLGTRVDGPGRVILSGRVISGESAGASVMLYSAPGEPVTLAGPLLGDLEALRGAQVTVTGDATPDGQLRVARYAVLEINGERPAVGQVARRQDDLVLLTEQGVRPLHHNSASPLEDLVGATVWVTGVQVGGRLAVMGHGVIRRGAAVQP